MNATTPDNSNEATGTVIWQDRMIVAVSVLLVLFQLYTAGFGPFVPLVQRGIHVGLGLFLAFAGAAKLGNLRRGSVWGGASAIVNVLAALASIAACIYIITQESRITNAVILTVTPADIVFGVALTVLVLEAARRTAGIFLAILAVVLLLYALFGNYIPGTWGHPPIQPILLLQQLFLGTAGIWGAITGLSANLIAIFIIMGAFLLVTGAAESFMDIAVSIAGRKPGGGAKVATVASALFGMLNGSAVANVVTCGNFTIPAMKRLGYRTEFAGAVEATASAGGQITPPIMGAGAFVMAQLLGVPYLTVAAAAVFPAFLFYACIWFATDIEARKEGMRPFPPEEIPPLRVAFHWRKAGPVIVTIVVVIGAMMTGMTAYLAGFYGICVNVSLFLLFGGPLTREALAQRILKLVTGARLAANNVVLLLGILVSAQIVVSLIAFTGVGVVLSQLIIELGTNQGMFVSLLLTLVVAVILGMGMPTTAAYLLAAAVTVPALSHLGLDRLSANFFVFYGALLSALTPPVCTAVFAAASITKTPWFPIAVQSMRLAAMKYLLPFFFVYLPAVLLIGRPFEIVTSVIGGLAASLLVSAGLVGFYRSRLSWPLRLIILVAGVSVATGADVAILAAVLICVAMVGTARYREFALRRNPG